MAVDVVTVTPGDRLVIRYDGPDETPPDRKALAAALPGVEIVLVLVEHERQVSERAAAKACATLADAGVNPLLAADLIAAVMQCGQDPAVFARDFTRLRGELIDEAPPRSSGPLPPPVEQAVQVTHG